MPQSKEKMRDRYWGRRNSGICAICKVPLYNDKVFCSACGDDRRKYQKEKRNSLTEKQLCYVCGKPTNTNGNVCGLCSVKKAAYGHLGSAKRYQELLDILEDQDGRCPYTGEQLVLGENASIDHILPRSRFPDLADNISNLQWVNWTVNKMKGDMTHDEFMAMVHLISRNRKET